MTGALAGMSRLPPVARTCRALCTATVAAAVAAPSLAAIGLEVLHTADPLSKAERTRAAHDTWRTMAGRSLADAIGRALPPAPPDLPARPPGAPELLEPKRMPTLKQCGAPPVIYLLHGLAHIELNAVDLYWDTLVRFARQSHTQQEAHRQPRQPRQQPEQAQEQEARPQTLANLSVPVEFYDDLLQIAADEARHFTWLEQHLRRLGSRYGALPAHNSLWANALSTRDDLPGRLAVVPLMQEARGLDAGPRLVSKLLSYGDKDAARIVEQICEEEVTHVQKGIKWFTHLCECNHAPPVPLFHDLLRRHLTSPLFPPFNADARARAGLTEQWYLPLAADRQAQHKPSTAASKEPGASS